MSFAAHDAKEQVRQAVDIVELIGSQLQLRRQGRMYVGLCPWHDDARPSLQVNPQRQSWRCWVCDLGGDVFSFMMQREGVGFREALELLADRAGIRLASTGSSSTPPGSPHDKRTLYQVLSWAESQFHQYLLHSPLAQPARQYLQDRGLEAATIARFHLGFAPNEWTWLVDRLAGTPWTLEVLEAAGLAARGQHGNSFYDRFRGRLIFPIRDTQNRPIAFGGRILPLWADERSAKYINSPETRLFNKSQQLYGLDLAREAVQKQREIVVVEGYTDVAMAHQFGVTNVAAVLGTALTMHHVQLLRRYADRIVLVLDGDEAGQRRTNEVLELFVAADADLRILTLPDGLDPCDYLQQQGAEAFGQLLGTARDALEHKIFIETDAIDLTRETHRAHQALERILQTVAKAPRQQAASSQRLREQHLLTRLARQFQFAPGQLHDRLKELRRAVPAAAARPIEPGEVRQRLDAPKAQEAELLEILLLHSELVGVAAQRIAPQQLEGSAARTIYEAMLGLLEQGRPVDFATLMTSLEDGQLKSILVRLDEAGTAKAEQAQELPATRLEGLIQNMERKQLEQECRQRLAALENRSLDEQEEYNTFLELVRKERDRRGISAPTDG